MCTIYQEKAKVFVQFAFTTHRQGARILLNYVCVDKRREVNTYMYAYTYLLIHTYILAYTFIHTCITSRLLPLNYYIT